MATTVSPAISNNIGLASRYLPILDEVYKAASKTAILDTADNRVRWSDEYHTFYLFETDMVGLADYSRNDGFVRGDVTAAWQSYAPQWERGRQFLVDIADNSESLDMAFGTLGGEFMRTKVVPETDALRFAAYATGAASGNKTTATLSTAAATKAAIDAGTVALDNAEVPDEGRILFVSPNVYQLLKDSITRMVMNGDPNVNNVIEFYNEMRVIKVPQNRFYMAVTLAQPTAHDGAGGYSANGNGINFLMLHPSAVMQANLLAMPRIFSPMQTQQAVAWQYDFRQYHGAWVKHQKTNGIYVSSDTTISG